MRIKRKDLIRVIREMAYMGQPVILKGSEEIFRDSDGDVERQNYDPSVIEKYFKSKSWDKKANKFYSRAFPDSNVWAIPIIGDINSIEVERLFEKFDNENRRYNRRGWSQPIDLELLKEIGLSEDQLNTIDTNKDIIFFIKTSYLEPGFYSSPHMTIHTLYDGGALFDLPLFKQVRDIFENHKDEIRSTATKSIRRGLPSNVPTDDYLAEVMTGAFLYRNGANLTSIPSVPVFSNMLSEAVNEAREFLKGKMVLALVLTVEPEY